MPRSFRFSLRALLICLVLLAMVVARYRDGLRDWLESFWEGKLVNQILIVGPPSTRLYTPPSLAEIAAALEKAGKVNRLPKNFRLVLEPIVDYDDQPDLTGAQLHHSRYKCVIAGDEETRTIFIDHNHLCLPAVK